MFDVLRDALSPRDGDPCRTVCWLAVFASAQIVLSWVFPLLAGVTPTSYGMPLVVILYVVLPSALLVLAVIARTAPSWLRPRCGLPVPLMFVAGTVVIHSAGPSLKSGDLLVLVLPVLYGAHHLKPAAAWVSTAAAVGGLATLSLLRLDTGRAWHEVAIGAASLITINALFVRMRDREDALHASLLAAAEVDPLTGLGNRRGMDRQLTAALRRGTPPRRCPTTQHGDLAPADNRHQTLALIVMDVDNFKAINDTFGHPVGDAALKRVADVIRLTFGLRSSAWRTGGDEMCVALWCGETAAEKLRRRLCDAVAASPLRLRDGQTVTLSVSAGLAVSSQHPDPVSLFDAADQRLYAAKASRIAHRRFPASHDPQSALADQAGPLPSMPGDRG